MALKQVYTCDITGKFLGEAADSVATVGITIVVPGAAEPRRLEIDASDVDPELAELLLRALVTNLERRGLHVWSTGHVATTAEPSTEEES